MSGDVQPRKRKDKKRRKDEAEQILTQPSHPPVTTSPSSDDVNIHVHKDGGTGGGICAKLVFFVLLSALVVVIGMIITEYRGLSDVDTVDSESKFAQIFEGWIDTGHRHEDHEIEEAIDEHDHEEDEEDASEDDDHEPSDEDEEEDEKEPSEEDEVEESEEEQSEENALDEDEDEDGDASPERIVYESEEKDEEEDEDDADQEEDEPEQEQDDEDHLEDEQELQNIESDEDNQEDETDASTEQPFNEDDDDEDDDKENDDESDESDEQAAEPEKVVEKRDVDEEEAVKEEERQESGGMAVKLGVGVALLVVAHLVLVRKWRSPAPAEKPLDEDIITKEPTPDLSRRNTIVAPPTLQEVEPDIEQDEEDYSEEEEFSEDEEQPEPKSAKTRYQELRSTYTRSMTPEGEIDYHKAPETYEEEYDEEELSEEEEEVEEDEEEDDDYDEDEDEELLKRLEAKYGKIQGEKRADAAAKEAEASDSDRESNEEADYAGITSQEDYKIKEKLDEAQKSAKNNSAYAIKLFDTILQKYPQSPRGVYGKALSLDYLADQKRSNEILQEALQLYLQLFDVPDVPDELYLMAAERCIERMRFVGQYRNAIIVHQKVINRFPSNPKHLNDLAVTYLTINRIEEARAILKQVLSKWPNDGFALVHYGFILKTTDNNLEDAVRYLERGLKTKAKGVTDGRFYFHLGDALARLHRTKEAMKIYEEGVKNKVFLSKYQRSLYNVPRLTGKPWWDMEELPYFDLFRLLSQNWEQIKEEGLSVLNAKGHFQDESENLKDTGDWKQFELFARGQKNVNNCKRCPFTCGLIEKIPEASGCRRGQTKFSVMHPGTHVWPHCGPTNCRLRVHVGLKVPPKTFIRVGDDIKSWKEGRVFVFDDSFEHEVWHNGTEIRLVLIVDVWHPELTPTEKRSLSPI